jgi:hypothetical protein
MRYFLLFLALLLQLNASGYTDDNPQNNCAQKTLVEVHMGVATKQAKVAETARLQAHYDKTGEILEGNKKSFKPKGCG